MLAALVVVDYIALVQPLVLAALAASAHAGLAAQASVQAMACVAPFGAAALVVP